MGRAANIKIRGRVLATEYAQQPSDLCDDCYNSMWLDIGWEWTAYLPFEHDAEPQRRERRLYKKRRKQFYHWLQW